MALSFSLTCSVRSFLNAVVNSVVSIISVAICEDGDGVCVWVFGRVRCV